jgi:hypothetical protein
MLIFRSTGCNYCIWYSAQGVVVVIPKEPACSLVHCVSVLSVSWFFSPLFYKMHGHTFIKLTVLCLHLSYSSCVLQCSANHISYIALKLLRLWNPALYINVLTVFLSPSRNIREPFSNFRNYRLVPPLCSELFISHPIQYLKFWRRYC